MSLLCNMLSRLVIAFLPRSKHPLIPWLQSPYAVILESKKIKSVTVSIISPSICHEVVGLHPMIFAFWMLSFKPAFSLSSFPFIKRLFISFLLSTRRVVSSVYSSVYLRWLIFLPILKVLKQMLKKIGRKYIQVTYFLLQGIFPSQGLNPCLFGLLYWPADS